MNQKDYRLILTNNSNFFIGIFWNALDLVGFRAIKIGIYRDVLFFIRFAIYSSSHVKWGKQTVIALVQVVVLDLMCFRNQPI